MRQQRGCWALRATPWARSVRRQRHRAPAAAMVPLARAAARAASSTVLPRPMLTKTPLAPSADRISALTAFSVEAPPGRHRDQRVDRCGKALQRRVVGVGQAFDLAPVVIGDRQAKGFQPPGDGLPDAAHAEDADAAARARSAGSADSCPASPSCRRATISRRRTVRARY